MLSWFVGCFFLLTPAPAIFGTFLSRFRASAIPFLLCRRGGAASMPPVVSCLLLPGLRGVKVKLTMTLAVAEQPIRSCVSGSRREAAGLVRDGEVMTRGSQTVWSSRREQ